MSFYPSPFPVIKAGAPQLLVFQLETQIADQV